MSVAPTLANILRSRRLPTDKDGRHSYLPVYEKFFAPLKNQPITIAELGVDLGGSVRLWLEYFPKARIHGVDLNLPKGLRHERLTLHRGSCVDEGFLLNRFKSEMFDIIIDDASHYLNEQVLSLVYLWRTLKPGGMYFIEDVQQGRFAGHFAIFPGFTPHFLHKNGRYDDILFAFRKPTRPASKGGPS